MMVLDFSVYVAFLGISTSILGVSWVSRDYLSSLIGGMIIRRIKRIKPGTRIKILGMPHVIKGDVLSVKTFRTTLAEVGDGERLPGIRTGRIYILPNSDLVNNPVLMYGGKIVDQVVAYVERDPENGVRCMEEAIKKVGVKPKEVDMYQTKDKFAIYGVYESETEKVSKVRNNIMKFFVELNKKNSNTEIKSFPDLLESKITVPLRIKNW
jgi:small-conductance mechanosensitive channel